MSLSLRERWQKQLQAAQVDPSWQARVEVRVLRFSLSRDASSGEEAPLADFPLYEGKSVHGRTRQLLSPQEQERRLGDIARDNLERIEMSDLPGGQVVEFVAWQDVKRRRRQAAFREPEQTPLHSGAASKHHNQKCVRVHVGRWVVVFTPLLPHRYRIHFRNWPAKMLLILKFLGRILLPQN